MNNYTGDQSKQSQWDNSPDMKYRYTPSTNKDSMITDKKPINDMYDDDTHKLFNEFKKLSHEEIFKYIIQSKDDMTINYLNSQTELIMLK